jgi:hypothetical protein
MSRKIPGSALLCSEARKERAAEPLIQAEVTSCSGFVLLLEDCLELVISEWDQLAVAGEER